VIFAEAKEPAVAAQHRAVQIVLRGVAVGRRVPGGVGLDISEGKVCPRDRGDPERDARLDEEPDLVPRRRAAAVETVTDALVPAVGSKVLVVVRRRSYRDTSRPASPRRRPRGTT